MRFHTGTQLNRRIYTNLSTQNSAARFASSQHVSEFKKESGEGGGGGGGATPTLCIDGFFNNLNCLAVFLAHIVDSLHRATCDYDGEE